MRSPFASDRRVVTGWLPVSPFAQPPMMAENRPAPPPACTISSPPGRNFGRVGVAQGSGHALRDAAGATDDLAAGELQQLRAGSRPAAAAFDQPASREHAGVLGADDEDGVEAERQLRVVHRAQARGERCAPSDSGSRDS